MNDTAKQRFKTCAEEVLGLTKEQIYDKICGWIDDGKIVQKSSQVGVNRYYDIWKGVESGDLFMTSNARIVVTDMQVRDQLQALISAGRVMNLAEVTIYHPECKTAFSIAQMVKRGELLKIDKLSSAAFYVE